MYGLVIKEAPNGCYLNVVDETKTAVRYSKLQVLYHIKQYRMYTIVYINGSVAQLVRAGSSSSKVTGSSPVGSTNYLKVR